MGRSFMFRAPLHDTVSCWPFREGTGSTVHDVFSGLNGTIYGTPAWATSEGIRALDLEASSATDRVDMGDQSELDFGTGEFTIAGWFLAESLPGSAMSVLAKGSPDLSGYALAIHPTNTLRFLYGATVTAGTTTLSTATWYHGAIVRDASSDLRLYLNGSLDNTPVNYTGPFSVSDAFIMGRWSHDPSAYFDGMFSAWRVYDRGLSAEEIAYLATLRRI